MSIQDVKIYVGVDVASKYLDLKWSEVVPKTEARPGLMMTGQGKDQNEPKEQEAS